MTAMCIMSETPWEAEDHSLVFFYLFANLAWNEFSLADSNTETTAATVSKPAPQLHLLPVSDS